MNTNYVSGRGYIVIANELAKHIEGTNPVSLEEYEAVYNYRAARKVIGIALNKALGFSYGDYPGQIKESHREGVELAINQAVTVIGNPDLTMDMANAAVAELNAALNAAEMDINLPMASTADTPVWYTLCSSRGGKPLTASAGKLIAGSAAVGASTSGNNVWRFEMRADGETYNIVSAGNQYINPTATYDTQMSVQDTEPDRGFSISYSENTPGTYVIYTSDSQLNQTNKQSQVFNWYSSHTPDRADQGCSWVISLYTGVVVTADKTPAYSGWYEIKSAVSGMTITNMDELTLQNRLNNYSMQYVLEPEPSPKNWVYMEVEGNNCYFRGHNGFYLDNRAVCARTPGAYTFVASSTTPGAFDCRYWIAFNNTDSNTGNVVYNVLGRSSSVVSPHYFQRIPDEQIAQYDVWNVEFIGDAKGSLPEHDAKITIPTDNHHGLRTVFHNGTYFMEKGTNISASDVQVTHPRNINITNENPKITVDSENKKITVDYNQFNTSGIAEINEQPKEAGKVFDLWGRRVATPRHGLYIVNSRKVRL